MIFVLVGDVMTEQELNKLMYINKDNITIEEFKSLYNISYVEILGLLEFYATEDLLTIHLLAFSKEYNIDSEVLSKFLDIQDPKDLLTIYFYYKALSKVGVVTPYIIDKLIGIRCLGHDELREIYRTIDEYMTPEATLEGTISLLSEEAEIFFESSMTMSEQARDFILEILTDFYNLKDSFRFYDKEENLPLNRVLGDETFPKQSLSRRKLKKINTIISRFNNKNNKKEGLKVS